MLSIIKKVSLGSIIVGLSLLVIGCSQYDSDETKFLVLKLELEVEYLTFELEAQRLLIKELFKEREEEKKLQQCQQLYNVQ